MFCPKCGNADQRPESFCRQCGTFLPDFEKLKKKEIPPEQHIQVNSVLSLMTAIACGVLTILLHASFTGKLGTPVLIYITIGFLTAMFFWQVQTFWRTRQLKKHFPKRKQSAQAQAESVDTNPLIESVTTNELLSEPNFSGVVPPSVIEDTTKHLSEKV